jgi:hypothetical protein
MSSPEEAAKKYNLPLAVVKEYNVHLVAEAFAKYGYPLGPFVAQTTAIPQIPPQIEIPDSVRNQHIYVPGKTRHGKSTLLHAMAYQDIRRGAGVCVIDPKGDLVNSLTHWIPESRKDDCIYIDPDNPIPIDFLDYATPREKQTLIGELKHIITKGVDATNAPLMNSMLNDVIYTLLDANEHGADATFLDIHDFLAFKTRRDTIMKFVRSERYQERWNDANLNSLKERQPTLTRMNDFVSSQYLRTVLGCPKPELNVSWVMDNRKILLINLGGIDEPTQLLATLVLAKIHQRMKRRWKITNEAERIPFHLYVDEFGFFQTKEFAEMLSFDGGYGLRLTLANQYLTQLSTDIQSAIEGNVGSFIIFKIGKRDINVFSEIAFPYDPRELARIPKHHALYKIEGQQPIIKATIPPPPKPDHQQIARADYIRKRTLEYYACKCAPVSYPSSDDQPAKPEPQATLPPDARKAPGTPAPRRVFRPQDSRPRDAAKEPHGN